MEQCLGRDNVHSLFVPLSVRRRRKHCPSHPTLLSAHPYCNVCMVCLGKIHNIVKIVKTGKAIFARNCGVDNVLELVLLSVKTVTIDHNILEFST